MIENVNTPVLVELQPVNGEAKPVTTSLRVAEYFEKEHKNVLRDIKETISKCSESFSALNFELAEYTDEQGKERPMYLLTRDGFMMVAMGYTGEKAMQLKEAYINAFNEMERKLTAGSAQAVSIERLRALREFYTVDCGAKGTQATRALDRAWQRIEGISPLAIGDIRLANEPDDDLYYYVTVGEIAKMFGLSAIKMNPILTGLGLQTAERKFGKDGKPNGYEYLPTELGERHGGKRMSDSATSNVQKEVWSLKWHKEKLPAYLRETCFKEVADERE